MLKTIKKELRKRLLSFDKSTSFYSQGGEDQILQGIFSKMMRSGHKGFYVDIGAYHPYIHSNTHYFYLRGWRGINIDARPGSMDLFNKIRKNDCNLELGISSQEGTAIFYVVGDNSTMNSFSKQNLQEHGMLGSIKKEIEVPMKTLAAVLEEKVGLFEKIDFLNIDVEGYDLEVLKSNNWEKFQPNVVIIEIACATMEDIYKDESAKFLIERGYYVVAKNVIMQNLASVFFVRNGFLY